MALLFRQIFSNFDVNKHKKDQFNKYKKKVKFKYFEVKYVMSCTSNIYR